MARNRDINIAINAENNASRVFDQVSADARKFAGDIGTAVAARTIGLEALITAADAGANAIAEALEQARDEALTFGETAAQGFETFSRGVLESIPIVRGLTRSVEVLWDTYVTGATAAEKANDELNAILDTSFAQAQERATEREKERERITREIAGVQEKSARALELAVVQGDALNVALARQFRSVGDINRLADERVEAIEAANFQQEEEERLIREVLAARDAQLEVERLNLAAVVDRVQASADELSNAREMRRVREVERREMMAARDAERQADRERSERLSALAEAEAQLREASQVDLAAAVVDRFGTGQAAAFRAQRGSSVQRDPTAIARKANEILEDQQNEQEETNALLAQLVQISDRQATRDRGTFNIG